jgi:alcohol dehydrogenase
MTGFEFSTVRSMICRTGCTATLDTILQNHNLAGDVLIITDAEVRKAGLLEASLASFARSLRSVHIFDEVIADPPQEKILATLHFARTLSPKIIIGFGGGSVMDTAKIIAVLLGTNQPLETMYGVGNIKEARTLPLILIPTTAGTGSEVTPIAIVTTGETIKKGIVAKQLLPDIAILDASLTYRLPKNITAHTGIDAMVHAIEAYTSRTQKNPMSDRLARQALALLWNNILPVLKDGMDVQARENMLLGACLAGQAFANAPVAAVHALAYPLGGIFHLTHGLSNALVLPHVLRFNKTAANKLYSELAVVVEAGTTATDFIDALENICQQSGVERRLRDANIPYTALDELSQAAMHQTRLLANNPREVTYANARYIYEQAW